MEWTFIIVKTWFLLKFSFIIQNTFSVSIRAILNKIRRSRYLCRVISGAFWRTFSAICQSLKIYYAYLSANYFLFSAISLKYNRQEKNTPQCHPCLNLNMPIICSHSLEGIGKQYALVEVIHSYPLKCLVEFRLIQVNSTHPYVSNFSLWDTEEQAIYESIRT